MSKISVRVNHGVGAFTLSPSGRDVAMASKSGLFILDIQEPFSPPRWLPLRTLWEVADVQWCPHPNHPSWVVSTSNQKLILWNLAMDSSDAIESVLHGHKRAITDVNFNNNRPDIVASCSIDTYIHVWDLRDPLKPSQSFADFDAGAAQVKWCKGQPHVLASAHDNRLLIWDDRKSNIPVHEFAAHSGRINGIDFDHNRSNQILTCSTDRTVKLWDLNSLANQGASAAVTITTDFPVWRARFLPAGSGALLVPLRGGQNAAYLVDLRVYAKNAPNDKPDQLQVVRKFEEHTAPIRDVSIRREDYGYDILTWSADCNLKAWTVDSESLNKVGVPSYLPPVPRRDVTYHVPSQEPSNHKSRRGFFKLQDTSEAKTAHIDWIAGVQIGNDEALSTVQFSRDGLAYEAPETGATPVESLSKEVTAVSNKFPKVRFEEIDLYNGLAIISFDGPWGAGDEFVMLRVHMQFPSDYPFDQLKVQIEEDPGIDPVIIAEIQEPLATGTAKLAEYGVPALEYTIRYLMGEKVPLDTFLSDEKHARELTEPMPELPGLYDWADEDEYGINRARTLADASGESDVADHELVPSDREDEADDDDGNAIQYMNPASIKPRIDSTPLPKNCGIVWTRTNQLVCFFNTTSPTPTKSVSLDRVFAGEDDSDSDIYESDSDDFVGPLKGREWVFSGANLATMKSQPKSSELPLSQHGSLTEDRDSLSVPPKSRNTIKIVDFNHIMANRIDLGAEYMLDLQHTAVQMAEHNAQVAEKYGRAEDAYVFRLLIHYSKLAARDYLGHGDKGYDPASSVYFEWSLHPMQYRTSVKLMEYLAQSQNIQMLAAVACIIARSVRPIVERVKAYNELSGRDSYVPDSTVVLKVPGIGSTPIERTLSQPNLRHSDSRPELHVSIVTPRGDSNPSTPFNAISPANLLRRSVSSISTAADSLPHSYTSEFDWMTLLDRRDSTVSMLAGSSGQMSAQSSHTPVTGGGPGSLPLGMSPFGSELEDEPMKTRLKHSNGGLAVTVKVMNPVNYNKELLEESMGISEDLLELARRSMGKFNFHRTLYGDLLRSWGLYVKSLEVLKFNYSANYDTLKETPLASSWPLNEHSVDFTFAPAPDNPIPSNWSLVRKSCVLCMELINTQYFYCVTCNHLLHRRCAALWWESAEECASGCGCKCCEYV